jgi:hypothetical protein
MPRVAAMILYHYTNPENALLIPVVWLTKEESNLATEANAKAYAEIGCNDLVAVGKPQYGGPVRCVVKVERSKHVMRYVEFLQTTNVVLTNTDTGDLTGRDVLRKYKELSDVAALSSWWICTRAIPASRVCVPLTRAQAIEACQWHVETHPDAGGRDRFKQQRDSFAAAPDDTNFMLHDRMITGHRPETAA